MPAYFAKQPNGLFCRFSSVVDTVTHTNLTEQDVVDLFIEFAKEQAEYTLKHNIHNFNEVINDLRPYNNTVEEINQLVIEMGQENGLTPKEREFLQGFEIHDDNN